jgi:hypothetical protein
MVTSRRVTAGRHDIAARRAPDRFTVTACRRDRPRKANTTCAPAIGMFVAASSTRPAT